MREGNGLAGGLYVKSNWRAPAECSFRRKQVEFSPVSVARAVAAADTSSTVERTFIPALCTALVPETRTQTHRETDRQKRKLWPSLLAQKRHKKDKQPCRHEHQLSASAPRKRKRERKKTRHSFINQCFLATSCARSTPSSASSRTSSEQGSGISVHSARLNRTNNHQQLSGQPGKHPQKASTRVGCEKGVNGTWRRGAYGQGNVSNPQTFE